MNLNFGKAQKKSGTYQKTDNTIIREVTIAFRDQKCMQEVKVYPKEKIEVLFTKGVIEGSKIITLTAKDEKTILKVKWDIKLSGMMGMFTGMIKKHIKSGTEQALQKIKEEIER